MICRKENTFGNTTTFPPPFYAASIGKIEFALEDNVFLSLFGTKVSNEYTLSQNTAGDE